MIGFSQGAAMAMLVPGARWVALLSAIVPPHGSAPPPGADTRPSLHLYDPSEPHAELCRQAEGSYARPTVVHHAEGHAVPRAEEAVRALVRFVDEV